MRLLVTYDGSSASASVFPAAERLARRLSADVVLLRVHNTRGENELLGPRYFKELEEVWQRELDAVAARMKCPAQAVVRRLFKRFWVSDAIIDAATEFRADLIVMATQGESGLRHAFIGSTALGVLARSSQPIVLVRSGLEPRSGEHDTQGPQQARLLVTCDGSSASKAVFQPAAQIARAAGGELLLLRVDHPLRLDLFVGPHHNIREVRAANSDGPLISELERIGAQLDCPVRVVVRPLTGGRWNVVDEIRAAAEEFDADLVCMATRGHSGLRHLLVGSTALEVVARSDRPVMLVRSQASRKPRKAKTAAAKKAGA